MPISTSGRLVAEPAGSCSLNQNQKCTKQIFPFVYWKATFFKVTQDKRQFAETIRDLPEVPLFIPDHFLQLRKRILQRYTGVRTFINVNDSAGNQNQPDTKTWIQTWSEMVRNEKQFGSGRITTTSTGRSTQPFRTSTMQQKECKSLLTPSPLQQLHIQISFWNKCKFALILWHFIT